MAAAVTGVLLACLMSKVPVLAEEYTSDGHIYDAAAEAEREQETVQSNEISGWPQGPAVSAEGAVLMDMDTGTVLYAKNIHERLYPASTTKMLTCLIAAESLDLSDTVTFSHSAIFDVPSDGSNIGMDEGETITVEQCLYGIMVGSANECANAIAEKTAGSVEAFAELMNEKAQELGCTDSHFVNANGLFDENHYTSAYDLALIGKAFFNNSTLRQIGNTATYHFTATSTQPDDFYITNKHAIITGEYPYEGILGGKTGYTSQAKETLVTGCEQNGMHLVCVVMKEDAPQQFEDTISLFDYGYSSFLRADPAEEDTNYSVSSPSFMTGGADLLGSSAPALSIAAGSYIDLPADAAFDQVTSSIGTDHIITYTWGAGEDAVILGKAALIVNTASADTAEEASFPDTEEDLTESDSGSFSESALKSALRSRWTQFKALYYTEGLNGTLYINVITIGITVAAVFVLLSAAALLIVLVRAHRAKKNRNRRRRYHGGSSGLTRRSRRNSYQNDYFDQHRYDRYRSWDDPDDD